MSIDSNFVPDEKPKERRCDCGSTKHLHAYNGGYRCNDCYMGATNLDLLRAAYRDKGLARKPGETSDEWRARLIRIAKTEAKRIGQWDRKKRETPKRALSDCLFCGGTGVYKEFDDHWRKPEVCPICAGFGQKSAAREPGCDDDAQVAKNV